MPYINYRTQMPTSRLDRYLFHRAWAKKAAREAGWSPPYWPALEHGAEPLAVRLTATGISRATPFGSPASANIAETLLATAVFLPLGAGHAAVTHFHLANEEEARDYLLGWCYENLPAAGLRRLTFPTGPFPHLSRGATAGHWPRQPVAHAPATPPYLLELLAGAAETVESRRLYHWNTPPALAPPTGPAEIAPLNPSRLATDLLPLLQAATATELGWPPLDAAGARHLLAALAPWPVYGRLANVDGRPAGFVLLQPDGAAALRRAGGGRMPWWRAWLQWRAGRPFAHGRLLLAAVHPEYRRRGIGRQLLTAAGTIARAQGWDAVTIGPVSPDAPAAALLKSFDATARQRLLTYQLHS